jgi:hypothetical protein
MYTGKNHPMRAKESWSRNLMRLTKQFLELVSVFKEAIKNFITADSVQVPDKAKNLLHKLLHFISKYIFPFVIKGRALRVMAVQIIVKEQL